jgi:hypothetical protein
MVIFHSYVSLPEGKPNATGAFFYPEMMAGCWRN